MAVAAVPLLRPLLEHEPPVQVALVVLGDRDALFEPSDRRMRGGDRTASSTTDHRFRDLEVAAGVLKRLPSGGHALAALLPTSTPRLPARVLVDAALQAQAEARPDDQLLPIRLYDLDDPRAADVRLLVDVPASAGERLYLVTERP